MWRRFESWRGQLPYTDSLERRQALLLESMELSIAGAALLLLPLTFLSRRSAAAQLFIDLLLLISFVMALGGIALVRSGRMRASALLIALTLVAILSAMLYGNGIANGSVMFFAFSLPIAIGGMLAGHIGVIIICAACSIGVAGVALLERAGAPGAGFATRAGDSATGTIMGFIVLVALLGFFIDSLRSQAGEAMEARRARERELETMSRKLEGTVRERTADLEIALGALEQRAAEAERLLEDNARQRTAIRALSVPVLPLDGRTLVMPLVGELDGQRLVDVQDQALDAIERFAARRLLLDITGVPLVDTHVAQSLMRTLQAARLLGAEVVLVGVRPEVAQAIVGLGIDLGTIPAFADLQSALR